MKRNQSITSFLKDHPSYLKWGVERLAEKFGVNSETIQRIVKRLRGVKKEYITNLA